MRIAVPHRYGADVSKKASWLKITDEQKRKRGASMFVSHRDIAGLVRAIIASDVPYGIVYAVSDNPTRFYDLEAARALYGHWPVDRHEPIG